LAAQLFDPQSARWQADLQQARVHSQFGESGTNYRGLGWAENFGW
jgi:hypothetical protein